MSITNFSGNSFVAYTDIIGFKAMMNDGKRGPEALDALYSSGYTVIARQNGDTPRVEGVFVSDCGVLFVRGEEQPLEGRLKALLLAVESLNRMCFERAVSLTTSIAWGEFSYQERFEIPGIQKNPIYGNAYVAAFIDNETDKPKLFPNECRIVKKNLPPEVLRQLGHSGNGIDPRIRDTRDHFYFEWMRIQKT